MNILYTTSFNKHLYEATGKNLIQSFVHHKTAGDLLIAYEDEIDAIIPKHRKFLFHNLDCDDYLQNWLINNRDIIPEYLGGNYSGTFEEKFNQRASQWFRKIASLKYACSLGYDKIIFLDSDVVVNKHIPEEKIEEVFEDNSIFYHLGLMRESEGTGIESGIIGFSMSNNRNLILDKVFQKYEDGSFQDYRRWDDGFIFRMVVEENKDIKTRDIVTDKNAKGHVVQCGMLSEYLAHNKGVHWKKHGVRF